MSAARRKKRKAKRRQPAPHAQKPRRTESTAAEVLTVAWTLTIMATILAQVVAAGTRFLITSNRDLEAPSPLHAIPSLMMLVALGTGLLCLILTPFVYRLRKVPPPPLITGLGVVGSITPMLALLWSSLR